MLWSNGADLRDAENSIVSSLEGARVRVVRVSYIEFKEAHNSCWVNYLYSIWRHLVTNEIERKVDILKEE